MKFDVKVFALTCGIFWSVAIFVLTWWIIAFEGSTGETLFLGRFYFGYNVSPKGSFIGLIWAFFDGAISGAVFAWLYNFLAGKMTK